jgi:cytochrome P450
MDVLHARPLLVGAMDPTLRQERAIDPEDSQRAWGLGFGHPEGRQGRQRPKQQDLDVPHLYAQVFLRRSDTNSQLVRADKSAIAQHMDDEQVAAQMRTIISAGYEPVSATIAVSNLFHCSDAS